MALTPRTTLSNPNSKVKVFHSNKMAESDESITLVHVQNELAIHQYELAIIKSVTLLSTWLPTLQLLKDP